MRHIIVRAIYFIEFQALSEILAKYYDGSFAWLVQRVYLHYRHHGRRKGSVGGGCEKRIRQLQRIMI